MPEIEMKPLTSSNLAAAGYDDASSTPAVEFANGGRYLYSGVPREVFEGLVASLSPGSYLARQIKDRYRHTRES